MYLRLFFRPFIALIAHYYWFVKALMLGNGRIKCRSEHSEPGRIMPCGDLPKFIEH